MILSDTDLYRSVKNVWITKMEPCELLHFPPGWGHIVWTDDGPNIMTAPREVMPRGMGALSVHVWFNIIHAVIEKGISQYNTNKRYFQLVLRSAKLYAPDPENPIPARVNAAVMGL